MTDTATGGRDQNNTNQSTYYIYNPGFYTVTAYVGIAYSAMNLRVYGNDTLKLVLPKDTSLPGKHFIIRPVVSNTSEYTWQDGSESTNLYGYANRLRYSIMAGNGCGGIRRMNIVFRCLSPALFLPNAFTPNGGRAQ